MEDRSWNTRLLIGLSLVILFLGVGFLWFGLNPKTLEQPTLSLEATQQATGSATQGVEGERALVTKVVDGDTIVVNGEQTIRLIGIDTPETVDPRRPVACFGKEASSETKSLLSGKEVILQKDVSEIDKYKRLLRYVFLPLPSGQTLFVNDYLVREGFAKVLTYPPDVKYNTQFRQAETEAREENRGLWGRCR
ncbi:thermonuclease family protein [Candidatus Daviesbacteria bacterium]|nr:thermonuclease family protein [Candidatus Daviesbacteria bacterium]